MLIGHILFIHHGRKKQHLGTLSSYAGAAGGFCSTTFICELIFCPVHCEGSFILFFSSHSRHEEASKLRTDKNLF